MRPTPDEWWALTAVLELGVSAALVALDRVLGMASEATNELRRVI
jgi:hypothetical protein